MKMELYSWDDLVRFIRKEACVSERKPISESTTVSGDLGQEGDDADIFMERFFERFDIGRGDYDFSRYFLMEGEGVFYHLLRKFILRKPHSFDREVLTVGMLYRALSAGRWDAQVMRSVAGQGDQR